MLTSVSMDEQVIRPLIHIGYHKTGTTWLQKFLFKNSAVGFVSPFKKNDDLPELLIYPNSLEFDPNKCKQYFHPVMNSALEKGLVPVLSAERLSGYPDTGGYDSKELADRLARVFSETKVLIVIREQKSMILSAYKMHVRAGGVCPLREYLRPSSPGRDRKRPLFDFDHFKYHRLINYYINLFGRPNVLVLTYELFKEDPYDFAMEIIRFAGVREAKNLPYLTRVNESLSGFVVALRRRINLIAPTDRANPGIHFVMPRAHRLLQQVVMKVDAFLPKSFQHSFDNRLKSEISAIVGDRYKQSNRLTGEMLKLDLEKYGYDL